MLVREKTLQILQVRLLKKNARPCTKMVMEALKNMQIIPELRL